jgi:O-antigen/teichoic acid export membrane protein
MSNPLQKLASQTAIYGLSTIVGRLLNYFLVPFYTRIFATEIYGIVGEFYAYIPFLLILLIYGMETGFFLFFSNNSTNLNKVFSSIMTSLCSTTLIFIALIFIFLTPISQIIGYEGYKEYIIFVALIVAIDVIIALPFAKLRILDKAVKFAVIKIINILITIGLILYFLALCPHLSEYYCGKFVDLMLYFYNPDIGVGYVFIANLGANIITLIILLPEIFNVRYQFDWKLLKTILIYSLPILIAGFAGMMNETLDRLLIKYLLKTPESDSFAMSQLGIYSANYKLAMLMSLFIQMFRYAAEPFFFQNREDKNNKIIYAKATKYFTIFAFLIYLFVIFYLDLFQYLIGKQFREGLNVVPILLLANLFLGIFFNLSMWYKLNDMTKYGTYLTLIGAIITISLNFLLIPVIGYVGAAITTLFCYLIQMIISYLWGQKYYKIPYDLKNFFFYFVVTAIFFCISYFGFSHLIENKIILISLNTILLIAFIVIAIKKENLIPLFAEIKRYLLSKRRL